MVIPKDELFQKGSPKKILTFLRLKGRRLVGGTKVSFLGKEGGHTLVGRRDPRSEGCRREGGAKLKLYLSAMLKKLQ